MVLIRPMTEADSEMVLRIYGEGIEDRLATFETEVPQWPDWDRAHVEECRLVAVDGGRVVGWIALSRPSSRSVYRGVAELSVYVAREARGRGVGGMLLEALIEASEAAGFWTLQAGVFPENEASLRLHQRHGFRKVGVSERLGQHRGRWRDVVLLERRSDAVGT